MNIRSKVKVRIGLGDQVSRVSYSPLSSAALVSNVLGASGVVRCTLWVWGCTLGVHCVCVQTLTSVTLTYVTTATVSTHPAHSSVSVEMATNSVPLATNVKVRHTLPTMPCMPDCLFLIFNNNNNGFIDMAAIGCSVHKIREIWYKEKARNVLRLISL